MPFFYSVRGSVFSPFQTRILISTRRTSARPLQKPEQLPSPTRALPPSTFNGSETVIVIDTDKSISSGSVSSVIAAKTAHIYVSVRSGAAAGTYPIDTLYVVLN